MLFYLYFWPKEIYGSELNSSIINVLTTDSLIYKKIFSTVYKAWKDRSNKPHLIVFNSKTVKIRINAVIHY